MVLFFSAIALADVPISGQVFSSNGNPLAYAVISNGQDWVIADENGQFVISAKGDSLRTQRYGYSSASFAIKQQSFYTILLQLEPIKQKAITVSGENRFFNDQITNTYQRNIDDGNRQSVFLQIPGLTIRTYGGNAGIMTLGTNGSPTVNTKILLDDIDLTSAQNGETDLSQIPRGMIDQVATVNSPGILYGSGAADGVFKINPWQDRTSFSAAIGSYGYRSTNVNLTGTLKNWSTNLSAGYFSDDGNFPVKTDSSSNPRQNNDFRQQYIALRSNGRISARSNLKIFLMNSYQERGVAGSIAWSSPEARRDDRLQLGAISYNHLHKTGYTKAQINTRRSYEHYTDPGGWVPIDSEHTVTGIGLKIQHRHYFNNNISAHILYEGKQEKIVSTDVGNHNRLTNSLAAETTIPIMNKFKLSPALRYDFGDSLESNLTKDIRISYTAFDKLQLEYHIGTGFRYPAFNDMYWNPGGNPDLKPELSRFQIIKLKLAINSTDFVYLQAGNRRTDDLIQWAPITKGSFVWQPQNIASSRRSNMTVGSQFQLGTLPLQLSAHATYQKTMDIGLDKPLLYAPEIIGFAGINYKMKALTIVLSAHYTGERIVAYPSFSNPYDTLLHAYIQTNATLKYQIPLCENQLSFILNIINILDKQFETVSDYPEPGRTIKLGIKYIF